MCDECGCNDEKHEHKTAIKDDKKVEVNKSITEINDTIAHEVWHNLKDKKILCINVMGSPGSGKTTFIEGISTYIEPSQIAVIQGDLESDIDKVRLEKIAVYTYQINTHSGCHLNAEMIRTALHEMNFSGKKYLFIENVGNLVCPAGVKIGQHMNMVVSSTTEGSDKPKKYPHIFIDAKLVIISKSDLSQAVGFDEKMYVSDIKNINSKVKIIKTSVKEPESFKDVADFIEHEREHLIGKEHHH